MIVTIDSDNNILLNTRSNECNIPIVPTDLDAIEQMKKEMPESAIGIAAVQIGYPKRIFVLKDNKGQYITCINPVVDYISSEKVFKEEGCLSIPNFFVRVKRPKKICITYFDEHNILCRKEFEGLSAQAVCHEIDHLNGILLTQRIQQQLDKVEKINAEKRKKKESSRKKRR